MAERTRDPLSVHLLLTGSCRDTRVTYRNGTERRLSENGSRGSLMVRGSTNFRLHQVHLGPFAAPPSPQRGPHAGLVHAEAVIRKSHHRNRTEMTAFTHRTAWEAQLGIYWDNEVAKGLDRDNTMKKAEGPD